MSKETLYGPVFDEDGKPVPGFAELTRDTESARDEARRWASKRQGTVKDMFGEDTGLLSARQYAEYARDLVRNVAEGPGGGLADVALSGNYADLSGTPDLSLYATFSDLASFRPDWSQIQGRPSFSSVAVSGRYDDLAGTPDLSEFALSEKLFSGDYSDLSGLPDLSGFLTEAPVSSVNGQTGAVDVQTFSGVYADLTGTPSFSPVAKSGSYEDLTDKPDLSGTGAGPASWGDILGTLSDQTDLKGALDAKSNTGHGHSASDVVSGVFADERVSESSVKQHEGALSIDKSQVTGLLDPEFPEHSHPISGVDGLQEALNAKASAGAVFSGAYEDLSGLPDLSGFLTQAPVESVNGQTGAVAVDVFSGVYADLRGKPDLSGFLTEAPVTSVNGQTGSVEIDAPVAQGGPDITDQWLREAVQSFSAESTTRDLEGRIESQSGSYRDGSAGTMAIARTTAGAVSEIVYVHDDSGKILTRSITRGAGGSYQSEEISIS